MDDRKKPHYSTFEELRESLEDEPAADTLLLAVADAVARYDPETEAVVVSAKGDEVQVLIVRASGIEIVGTILFADPH